MSESRSNHGGPRIERKSETAFFHDWESDESLSTEIVSALEALAGPDLPDGERLYDRVDPDSLDTVFAPPNGRTHRNTGRLSFQLGAYTVTVHASGFVVLTAPA